MYHAIPPGTRCPECAHAQRLFLELSTALSGIEHCPATGLHTGASVRNVMWLQRSLGLAQTGVMDDTLLSVLAALHRSARRCSGCYGASI